MSDCLIDRCIAMYDANRVAYLSLDLCTKRTMDLIGVTKDPQYSQAPDASGYLKLKPSAVEPSNTMRSQFDLLHSLMRRGLALEMGDLLCFDLHEALRRRFLNVLSKEPNKGFLPVDMEQMLDADQLIW